MSLSNLLLPDASSDKTIYCHNVIADFDSTFTNIDISGIASCSTAPTLGEHLCNKTYVDSAVVGGGDVDGPASATDNAIARYDGATGKLIQNSVATLNDLGIIDTVGYFTSANPSTATSNLTNQFTRGNGISATGWVAFRCGANSTAASSDGHKIVMGNYAGNPTIGGHNNAHTMWAPIQIGEDSAGGITTIKGSSINLTNAAGVAVSSTTESTTTTTGSMRLAGGAGILKNLFVGGTGNIAGNLTVGTDLINGHIHTRGLVPTISATHTIQSWSTDVAGEITVAASSTATITFATTYTSALGLSVVLTPKTAGAGAYYVGATSTANFTVVNVVASPITFMYHVIACF